MSENHKFGLYVAESAKKAQIKAQEEWKEPLKIKHKDDLSKIKKISSVDNCLSIKTIKAFRIFLSIDSKKRSQSLIPDWYGYKRIDKD